MKIVIVGAGEIGRHMALSLSQDAHSIVVIEADETVATDIDSQIDARVLNADGSSVNTLIEAGAAECDLFFSLTSDNNINLVCSSIAKKIGAKKTICRVHPGLQREEWLFDLHSHFHIDYLFSSERLAAIELSKFVRNPDSLVVEELARGHIELQQLTVPSTCDVIGIPLRELKLPPRVRIGTILRGDEKIIPAATDKLHAGDVITLFGDPNKLREVIAMIRSGGKVNDKLSVVIFGGGEYGFSLAQMLEAWGYRVRIFETDPERCAELTDLLSSTTVLNADATKLSEMREETVGEVDFFVATSTSDEDNVMTCLQAQSLGAKHCLTLIHRADYADAIMNFGGNMGIRAAVSPREATRQDLTRFVTSDKYHLLKELDAGLLIETNVCENSLLAGKTVKEIAWPADCVLVALLHGIRAIVPGPDDEIKGGDHLYAVVSKKSRKKLLKLVTD